MSLRLRCYIHTLHLTPHPSIFCVQMGCSVFLLVPRTRREIHSVGDLDSRVLWCLPFTLPLTDSSCEIDPINPAHYRLTPDFLCPLCLRVVDAFPGVPGWPRRQNFVPGVTVQRVVTNYVFPNPEEMTDRRDGGSTPGQTTLGVTLFRPSGLPTVNRSKSEWPVCHAQRWRSSHTTTSTSPSGVLKRPARWCNK